MAFREDDQQNPDFYLAFSYDKKFGAVFPAKPEIADAFARAGFTKMTPILFWAHNTNKRLRYTSNNCNEELFIWAEIQALFKNFTYSKHQGVAFGWWLKGSHTANENFHSQFLPYFLHHGYHISKSHLVNIQLIIKELKPEEKEGLLKRGWRLLTA